MLIGTGNFAGTGGHTLFGSFSLTRCRDGVLMETSADFYFDGAPDPGWALYRGTPKDRTDPDTVLAALTTKFGTLPGGIKEVHGCHAGLIPSGIDIDDYDTVFLWCFAVPFILGIGRIIQR